MRYLSSVFLCLIILFSGLTNKPSNSIRKENSNEMLYTGYSETELNWSSILGLAGYERRFSSGIHDPLTCRALVLQKDGTSLMILSLDIVFLGERKALRLRKKISRRTGIPEGNILIHCIHTHSAPVAWGFFSPSAAVEKKIVQTACNSLKDLEPVIVEMNFIHKDIGVNNRRKREEITSSIGYLKFQRTDGSTKNLLINMACHPVILGPSNLEISSDYVFYLRNILEEQTGAEVIFLSADLGDKNPPPIGYLRKGTFSDASAFAETAASAILETQEGSQELDVSHIAVYTEKTFAPIENKEYARVWQLGNPIFRLFHPDMEIRRGSKSLYLTYAELGELVLITSPGESTTAHRQALAERLGLGDHLYLDITNGYSGYILAKGEWNPHGDEERRNKWISKGFSDQIIQTYSSAVSRITRE